jgi:hypothetical protein
MLNFQYLGRSECAFCVAAKTDGGASHTNNNTAASSLSHLRAPCSCVPRELTGVCLGKTNNGAFIISELTNKWRGVSENLLHLRRFIVCACFCDVMI